MATELQIRLAREDHWDILAQVNAKSSERTHAVQTRAHPPEYIQALNDEIAALRGTMFTKRAILAALLLEPLDP